jgi:hypothetical protein
MNFMTSVTTGTSSSEKIHEQENEIKKMYNHIKNCCLFIRKKLIPWSINNGELIGFSRGFLGILNFFLFPTSSLLLCRQTDKLFPL